MDTYNDDDTVSLDESDGEEYKESDFVIPELKKENYIEEPKFETTYGEVLRKQIDLQKTFNLIMSIKSKKGELQENKKFYTELNKAYLEIYKKESDELYVLLTKF